MSESGSTPTKPVPAPRRGSKPKEPRASNKLKNFKTHSALGFGLKSEQREALELLLGEKDVFCVPPTALFIRCLFMQRPTVIVTSLV